MWFGRLTFRAFVCPGGLGVFGFIQYGWVVGPFRRLLALVSSGLLVWGQWLLEVH